jgi:hypothetical protein
MVDPSEKLRKQLLNVRAQLKAIYGHASVTLSRPPHAWSEQVNKIGRAAYAALKQARNTK